MAEHASPPCCEPDRHLSGLLVEISGSWNRCRKTSGSLSLGAHAALLALVFVLSGRVVVPPPKVEKSYKPEKSETVSIYLPPPSAANAGGGGGDRSELPAPFGRPPAFARMQLAPPLIVIRNQNPVLQVDPTVIGPPDLNVPLSVARIGDPFGPLGPDSNGPGSGGGIGRGQGGGVGPGRGPGVGPGRDGGWHPGIYRPGADVTAPELVFSVEPEYSEEARKAKHQGTVILHIIVEPDGRVRQFKVAQSVGLGLDERAMEAVRQWKFRPGMRGGRPVSVLAAVEVTFRLL